MMVTTTVFMFLIILMMTVVTSHPLGNIPTRNEAIQLEQVSRGWGRNKKWGHFWRERTRDAVFKAKYGEPPPPHGFYSGTSLPPGESAPDMFSAGKKMMGDTPPLTAEEFMLRLQVIEEKLQNSTKLCADERLMWEGVRQQLQTSLSTDYCTEFDEYHGACCYILAEGENFGFCTYDTLIVTESSDDVIGNCILPEKLEPSPECDLEASMEPEESDKCQNKPRYKMKEGYPEVSPGTEITSLINVARRKAFGKRMRTSSRYEVFVNLMASVSCTATDSTSLCSAFCCTEKYAQSEFCDVPCY